MIELAKKKMILEILIVSVGTWRVERVESLSPATQRPTGLSDTSARQVREHAKSPREVSVERLHPDADDCVF
jgi:hypothetical protein